MAAEATGNGGSTGGFAKQGNGWTALAMQRQGIEIYLIQPYLRTGKTLQSPLNAEILGQLLQFLDHLHAPFIVGGDWQSAPEELAATAIPSRDLGHSWPHNTPKQSPRLHFGLHFDCGLPSTASKLGSTLEASLCPGSADSHQSPGATTCPTSGLASLRRMVHVGAGHHRSRL